MNATPEIKEKTVVKALPSASIMLLRDGTARRDGGSRIEVLMMERHGKMRFAAGALVFPGGKVDQADSDPALFRGYHGLAFLPHRFAAIREMFEEAGVLLACRHKALRPVSGRAQVAFGHRYRRHFLQGNCSLLEMRRLADVTYRPDQLVPFAHWITPEWQPLRFSTVFFLAALPPGQVARHEGDEAIRSFWARPQDILGADGLGPKNLMFPTRLNLAKLASSYDVRQAMERARRSPPVTVTPHVVRGENGAKAYIPLAAGYGGSEFRF